MANYLLIESRDAYEYADVGYFCGMAKDLATGGNEVTLFLIQNAVLIARKTAAGPAKGLLEFGPKVKVLADDFCLRERGIDTMALIPGITVSNVDTLVELLIKDGVKAVWH